MCILTHKLQFSFAKLLNNPITQYCKSIHHKAQPSATAPPASALSQAPIGDAEECAARGSRSGRSRVPDLPGDQSDGAANLPGGLRTLHCVLRRGASTVSRVTEEEAPPPPGTKPAGGEGASRGIGRPIGSFGESAFFRPRRAAVVRLSGGASRCSCCPPADGECEIRSVESRLQISASAETFGRFLVKWAEMSIDSFWKTSMEFGN